MLCLSYIQRTFFSRQDGRGTHLYIQYTYIYDIIHLCSFADLDGTKIVPSVEYSSFVNIARFPS